MVIETCLVYKQAVISNLTLNVSLLSPSASMFIYRWQQIQWLFCAAVQVITGSCRSQERSLVAFKCLHYCIGIYFCYSPGVQI